MPVTKYQYTISTDFPNAKVNVEQLQNEILQNPGITILVEHIDANVEPDKCDIFMADALPAPEIPVLDGIVAAHQGIGYATTLLGTLTALSEPVAVTEDLNWQMLYRLRTTPTFFTNSMPELLARLIGEHKGDGGEITIVEGVTGEPDVDIIAPPFALPDTAGSWEPFKADSNVPPREGLRNSYSIMARLNGATSLEMRFTTATMVLAVPVVG